MIHTRSSARGVLHGPFSYINKVGRGRDSDLAKMESFAKKLASSGLQMRHVDTNKVDGSVRDKAFKSLRMWLEKRCGMWMADRPSYQQNLATRLGDILLDLHRVDSQAALLYARTFWETICREWSGIDRLRRFYLAGMQVLSREAWASELVEAYNKMLSSLPLHPTRGDIPDSFRTYFLENFAEIMRQVGGERLEPAAARGALKPFFELIQLTEKKVVLRMAKTMSGELEGLLKGEETRQSVAKMALEMGEVKSIGTRNRKVLYSVYQKLSIVNH